MEVATKPEINPANRARIDQALRLAEKLGAKARTIAGRSIQEAVFAYARKHNITKIVVGKPLRPRWQEWLSGSVVDQLIYASGDIDIYVISAQAEDAQTDGAKRMAAASTRCCAICSAWALVGLRNAAQPVLSRQDRAHQPGDDLPGGRGRLGRLPGTRAVAAGRRHGRAGFRFLSWSRLTSRLQSAIRNTF